MTQIKKPIPIIDGDSKKYWDACQEGKLIIQKCDDCERHIFYPRIVCPHCMSNQISWIESSGKGKVYSYTIARRAISPAFESDIPYAVALIDLEEGVRLLSNIVNCDVEQLNCGLPVEVIFEEREGMKIPVFQLIN